MQPIAPLPQVKTNPADSLQCTIDLAPGTTATIRFSATPKSDQPIDLRPYQIPQAIFQTKNCLTGTQYAVRFHPPSSKTPNLDSIHINFIRYAAKQLAFAHIAALDPLPQLPYHDHRHLIHCYPDLRFPEPSLIALDGTTPVKIDNACVLRLNTDHDFEIWEYNIATIRAHHALMPKIICTAPEDSQKYAWSDRILYLTPHPDRPRC